MDNRLWRAVLSYVKELEERNLDKGYVRQTKRTLRKFVEFCDTRGVRSCGRIDAGVLKTFLDLFAMNSASYQRFVYAITRGFLRFAESPLALKFRYHAKGRDRRVRWLTAQETETLLTTTMRPREMLILTAGLLEGMRMAEVRRLTTRDAKDALRTGEISLYAKGKIRTIPVHPEFAQTLRIYLQATDLDDGSLLVPISSGHYSSVLRELGRRTGILLTAHTLRRSCLTRLREADVPLDVISRIAGHSSIAMTEHYLRMDAEKMKNAIMRLKVPTGARETLRPI